MGALLGMGAVPGLKAQGFLRPGPSQPRSRQGGEENGNHRFLKGRVSVGLSPRALGPRVHEPVENMR